MVFMTVIMPVAMSMVMVVADLRRVGRSFMADDLLTVLAQLTIHIDVASQDFLDSISETINQVRMVIQTARFDDIDVGMGSLKVIGPAVNAIDQGVCEQEIGKNDNSPISQLARIFQTGIDEGISDIGITDLGPTKAHSFPQHAGDFVDV